MSGKPAPLPLIVEPDWLGEPAPPVDAAPASAAAETARETLIGELVEAGGSADAADVALVSKELEKLPDEVLAAFQASGAKVVVCRDSVTDHRTDLRGVHPRGWAPGKTWDSVPGLRSGDEVLIAVVGHGTPQGAHVPVSGEGHGSASLVFHEMFHAIDGDGASRNSATTEFNDARDGDQAALTPYQNQPGAAGQEETYAESAAGYYSGDADWAQNHPNLNDYWDSNPLEP